jgi:hypothetical protein
MEKLPLIGTLVAIIVVVWFVLHGNSGAMISNVEYRRDDDNLSLSRVHRVVMPNDDAPDAFDGSSYRGAQRLIDWKTLTINRGAVPSQNFGEDGFRDILFGVLSDGVLQHRLHAALSTWLRDSFHTFIYFSDIPSSREVSAAFESFNTSVVFLKPPPSFRFGNWKNLPILQHLADVGTQTMLRRRGAGARRKMPRWYVVVDDDSYLLQPAVTHVLAEMSREVDARPDARIYAGHTVVRCQTCRNVNKRFPFAFGGNGIFLSHGLLLALAKVIPQCVSVFATLPGDEQVGGCIHRFHLARLNHLAVGTETFAMAFGDKIEVLAEAPFPFAFHRITTPSWHLDMAALEARYRGQILSWPVIADYFMEELGGKYNREALVFRETVNTTAVQTFLSKRRLRQDHST